MMLTKYSSCEGEHATAQQNRYLEPQFNVMTLNQLNDF